MWLRIAHFVRLTNLSNDQVEGFYEISTQSLKATGATSNVSTAKSDALSYLYLKRLYGRGKMSERNELAKRLAINHLVNSSKYIEKTKILKLNLLSSMLPGPKGEEGEGKKRAVVAVIGAGASAEVGLPVGKDAVNLLEEKFKKYITPLALELERKRLFKLYGMPKDGFETTMLALARYPGLEIELRNTLKDMYGFRFPSIVTYEILAHLLKHRFIDAIINFNFDELLDQSIEDELGSGEYHYVLSDGDCKELLTQVHPFSLPVYIKPHGTASHISSLRFTRESYYGVPEDIQKVMATLLTGHPLTLMVVGFSMQSIEFNTILEGVSNDSELFIINHALPEFASQMKEKFDVGHIQVDKYPGEINEKLCGIDKAMIECWASIEQSFKPNYKPRGIKRHILISKIFKDKCQSIKDNLAPYLKDRTTVEIGLSIAKGRGLLDISSLATERAGKYFNEFRKCEYDRGSTLPDICQKCDSYSISYSGEVLRYNSKEAMGIISRDEFDAHQLAKNISPLLSKTRRPRLENSFDEFVKTLEELFDTIEIEIGNKIDPMFEMIFEDSKHLHTHTLLQYETRELLDGDFAYDTLLIVAETGQWLCHGPIKDILVRRKPNIALVLADRAWEKKLREIYSDRRLEIRQMPWWEHNRHMTISLKRGSGSEKVGRCIYFLRRNRDHKISPILLTKKSDKTKILSFFRAYWGKAVEKHEFYSEDNLPSVSSIFK